MQAAAVDKTMLLKELTIERQPPPPRRWWRKWVLVGGLCLILLIIAVLALKTAAWLQAGEGVLAPTGGAGERAEAGVIREQPEQSVKQLQRTEPLAVTGDAGGRVQTVSIPAPHLSQSTATTAAGSISPVAPAISPTSVLDASGYVVARQAATVSAKTTGKIVAVLIEEGMRVEQGQIMARLDDSHARAQLALTQSQVLEQQALAAELATQLSHARRALARASALAADSLLSEAQLDRLQADADTLLARSLAATRTIEVTRRRAAVAQLALEDMVIRAPFTGVVISKSAQPGEMISPISAGGGFTRTGIGTIVDMQSLEVEVDVNEAYINRVFTEQPVNVILNAYPEQHYPGRVLAVIPTADRNKATIRVRVRLLATDQRVLPQMGVRVAFMDG